MSNIAEDLRRYAGGSLGKSLYTIFLNPNFKAILNFRIAHYLYTKLHFVLIPTLLRYRNRVKYAIDIDYRAQIGPGFMILHGVGLVIGMDVRAGRNLCVYQGVTCGGNDGKTAVHNSTEFSQPWLGDNVILSTGASLFGPVYVGDGTVIGAKSLIMKDIPENSIAYCKTEMIIRQNIQEKQE